VHLAGVALATLAGGVFPFHPQLIALVVLFFVTNFGEEIGWRGYALPKLQDRMSPLAAAVVLGLVWAVFHWVALAGNDTPLAYIAVSTVHLVAISVFMSYIFNRSRESVPAVALAHALYDTVAIGVAPLIETTVPLLAFALTAVVAWVAVVVLVALTGPSLGKETGAAHDDAARANATTRPRTGGI
jgi:membrane protease YdiL (CAAX protease family)